VGGWRVDVDSPLLEPPRGHRTRLVLPAPAPVELPEVSELLAGAAETDITPPPGLPLAGFSRRGRVSTGMRTRLRARVLHLRAGRASLAIVSADLLAGSPVVTRLVAADLATGTDVGLDGLLFGVTHTHAGPGGHFGSDVYNSWAAPTPGFDPVWTQFLASRIAAAVREAVLTRQPAMLGWGSTQVDGLTRLRTPAAPPTPPAPLHLLRVDAVGGGAVGGGAVGGGAVGGGAVGGGAVGGGAVGGGALAAWIVFGVHGTAVGRSAGVYHADLWHHAVTGLGRRVAADGRGRPVVGALEGCAGDVAPALGPAGPGHPEAERIGTDLGAAAAELYAALDGRLDRRPALAGRLVEVPASGAGLAVRPAFGTGMLIGTRPDPPLTARLPIPRTRRRPREGQGVKRVLAGRGVQSRLVPPGAFPRVLPVQALLVGDTWLLGVPVEMTAASGARLAADVGPRVVLTCAAGDYAGYCTTPQEYDRQFYEGAHTLYGPGTAAFLTEVASRLTEGDSPHADDRTFDLRSRHPAPPPDRSGRGSGDRGRGDRDRGDRDRGDRGRSDRFGRTVTAAPRWRGEHQCWEMSWEDPSTAPLAWHEPLVRVEAARIGGGWDPGIAGGIPDDDTGHRIAVTAGRAGSYAVRWFAPGRQGRFRFVLVPNAGRAELVSEPFG
jgi:neutral ceramidase